MQTQLRNCWLVHYHYFYYCHHYFYLLLLLCLFLILLQVASLIIRFLFQAVMPSSGNWSSLARSQLEVLQSLAGLAALGHVLDTLALLFLLLGPSSVAGVAVLITFRGDGQLRQTSRALHVVRTIHFAR